MSNSSYFVDAYNATLKSEITGRIFIIAALLVLLLLIFLYSFLQIRKDKAKKGAYTFLGMMILVFAFFGVSLGSEIASYAKDIREQAYIMYEGPATIRTERQVVYGSTMRYDNYVLSFYDDQQIEIYMEERPKDVGNVKKMYIVYSQHAKCLLEYRIIEY